MDIKSKVADLQLEKNSYIVTGSGILQALGIRLTQDVDLVVSGEVFERLQQQGWTRVDKGEGVLLVRDVYDVSQNWFGRSLEEILRTATWIDEVPYLSLEEVLEWKKSYRRPKDIQDIALIERYLETAS